MAVSDDCDSDLPADLPNPILVYGNYMQEWRGENKPFVLVLP